MRVTKSSHLEKKSPNAISRRTFLISSAAIGLSLGILEALRITLAFLKPPPTKGFGGLIKPGKLEELAPGSVTYIRQGRFYLVHNSDGILAMFQRCTHLGCLVRWDADEDHFICPCHAGQYNREGEVISGPPPQPLGIFKLEITDGDVVVDTSQVIQRDHYEPSQAIKG
ncbi:MAG: Rieske 2Fe-2S domain-containing protein [Anaerolineae bacterium]|nr:Rieske 2Fe-2S domain-containing protein [Anaerolineae bacterium]